MPTVAHRIAPGAALELLLTAETLPPAPYEAMRVVTSAPVNVYGQPDSTTAVLRVVPVGSPLDIFERRAQWWRVWPPPNRNGAALWVRAASMFYFQQT